MAGRRKIVNKYSSRKESGRGLSSCYKCILVALAVLAFLYLIGGDDDSSSPTTIPGTIKKDGSGRGTPSSLRGSSSGTSSSIDGSIGSNNRPTMTNPHHVEEEPHQQAESSTTKASNPSTSESSQSLQLDTSPVTTNMTVKDRSDGDGIITVDIEAETEEDRTTNPEQSQQQQPRIVDGGQSGIQQTLSKAILDVDYAEEEGISSTMGRLRTGLARVDDWVKFGLGQMFGSDEDVTEDELHEIAVEVAEALEEQVEGEVRNAANELADEKADRLEATAKVDQDADLSATSTEEDLLQVEVSMVDELKEEIATVGETEEKQLKQKAAELEKKAVEHVLGKKGKHVEVVIEEKLTTSDNANVISNTTLVRIVNRDSKNNDTEANSVATSERTPTSSTNSTSHTHSPIKSDAVAPKESNTSPVVNGTIEEISQVDVSDKSSNVSDGKAYDNERITNEKEAKKKVDDGKVKDRHEDGHKSEEKSSPKDSTTEEGSGQDKPIDKSKQKEDKASGSDLKEKQDQHVDQPHKETKKVEKPKEKKDNNAETTSKGEQKQKKPAAGESKGDEPKKKVAPVDETKTEGRTRR